MYRHILPNAFMPVLVSVTMSVGGVILAEAGLSFLGLGVMPPTPTWGNMMREANNMEVLQNMPWIWAPAAVMITITTLCVNFVGDGLRDAFDPRQIM
jgi:peptide/nickel transport system permease protein